MPRAGQQGSWFGVWFLPPLRTSHCWLSFLKCISHVCALTTRKNSFLRTGGHHQSRTPLTNQGDVRPLVLHLYSRIFHCITKPLRQEMAGAGLRGLSLWTRPRAIPSEEEGGGGCPLPQVLARMLGPGVLGAHPAREAHPWHHGAGKRKLGPHAEPRKGAEPPTARTTRHCLSTQVSTGLCCPERLVDV